MGQQNTESRIKFTHLINRFFYKAAKATVYRIIFPTNRVGKMDKNMKNKPPENLTSLYHTRHLEENCGVAT